MQIVRFRAAGKTRTPFTLFRRGRRRYPLKQIVLLTPVVPSKIVALGLNYRDHAAELGLAIPDEPIMFLKPPSALVGPDDPIVYPRESQRVDHERELAIVTARDLQAKDVRGSRAKAFDTFCPLGPCIATGTPPGVGPLLPGDRVEIRIEGIGSLKNTVVKL